MNATATKTANWGKCICSETQLDRVGCECICSYTAEEVRRFVINSQVYRGQMARLNGEARHYGCHFGMRSTRESDMASFYEGWNEIDAALGVRTSVEIENGWRDEDGSSLLSDETDENGIPS